MAKISATEIKIIADAGHPCLIPLSSLNSLDKFEKPFLFIGQLCECSWVEMKCSFS